MDRTELAGELARLPHFSALGPELLSEVARGVRTLRFDAGAVVFSQGEPARAFFAVRRGAVKVYRMSPDGREKVLHTVRDGRTVAEAAVLSFGSYPAHCVVLEDGTELLEIEGGNLLRLFERDPRLARSMVSSMAIWLHGLAERIEELQVSSAGARLARYLLKLPAKGTRDPLEVELPLAKKDLAAHLAITPETLSRLLRRWQDQGIADTRGKQILLLDSRVLTAIADEA